MSYVISRLAPDAPSGVVYWTGELVVQSDDGRTLVSTADDACDVLVIAEQSRAEALVLWLNTSPARRFGLWQALPIASPTDVARGA